MIQTPQKKQSDVSLSCTLTPVRFILDKSPSKDFKKSRLNVIICNLLENYSKWELAQKRGLQVCYSIEAIKTRCLESKSSLTPYPPELQPHCDKLAVITSIFEDITNSARDSLLQIHALHQLERDKMEIIYRTWLMEHFIEFFESIVKKYEAELAVKKLIMREIAHCQIRTDLVRLTSFWEYPQNVDDNVQIMFKFIKEEINCK